MNKIAIFYDHILTAAQQRGWDTEAVLRQAKVCGIDLLEIDSTPAQWETASQTKALFDRCGMGVSCVCMHVDMLHGSDQDAREIWHRTLLQAEQFACSNVLCVPGYFQPSDDREAVTLRLIEQLTVLCAQAAEYGITVTVEDFDNILSPCCTTAQLQRLLAGVKDLGLTLDTGNFRYCLEDLATAYPLLRERVVHVHCKDRALHPPALPCPPAAIGTDSSGAPMYAAAVGDGELEIGRWIRQLVADGYTGAFTIEHFGIADQFTAMCRSAETIQKSLQR